MHLPEYQGSKRNLGDTRKCFRIPQTTPCSKLNLQSMSYPKNIHKCTTMHCEGKVQICHYLHFYVMNISQPSTQLFLLEIIDDITVFC